MREKETIKLSRLSTGYSGKHGVIRVAADIDASVYGGELTCLLGANGAGKSTLLRTLSASQPPLSGEVWIGEKRLAEYSDKELAKVVGIVLTERCEVENLTVEELVGMGRTPYTGFWGTLRKEDKQIVAEAISQVGISKLSHRMVQTLSDGERQKVMIAKALAQQTPIILLDEPTAFLDFSSKVEVMRLLRTLAHDLGKTVFLSTHDLELALQIADKLWLMNAGGIVAGTPEDLSLSGTLEAFFAHEGIVFDRHTGLFRIAFDYMQNIRLIGEGYRYDMVQKALRRQGIRAGHEVRSLSYIDAGSLDTDSFVWHPETGEAVSFGAIGDMLDYIAPILIDKETRIFAD